MRKKKTTIKKSNVIRTRNSNTWTEAEFFGKIRSSLRRVSQFWKPVVLTLEKAKRNNLSENKRLKYEYQCSSCKNWFPKKSVQVHHIIPAGSLRSYLDLPLFCERLFSEDLSNYEVLCKECHSAKH